MTAPALIAFRDGVDAPWQTPVAADVGRYEIEVHGPYTVEEVCTDVGFVTISEVAQTLDDPRDLELPCFVSTPLSHVTGTMVQVGHVAAGTAFASGNVANWPFDLATGDGTFDLIARTNFGNGGDEWIAIHRDLTITDSTMVIPPIDAVKEGARFVALPVTVTNPLPSELVAIRTTLATRSTVDVVSFVNLLGAVRVVPDTLLLPTDTQRVAVIAFPEQNLGFRSITRTLVPGGSTEFTLPPVLDSLNFAVANDQLVATWSALPAYDRIALEVDYLAAGTVTLNHFVELSVGYVTATGITSAALDTDLPGYSPEWRVDFTKPYRRDATVIKDGMDTTVSATEEDVNGPSSVSAAVSPVGRARACSRMSCDGGRRRLSALARE